MKKFVIIVGTVGALILLTMWADRATRHTLPASASIASDVAGKPAPDQGRIDTVIPGGAA